MPPVRFHGFEIDARLLSSKKRISGQIDKNASTVELDGQGYDDCLIAEIDNVGS